MECDDYLIPTPNYNPIYYYTRTDSTTAIFLVSHVSQITYINRILDD